MIPSSLDTQLNNLLRLYRNNQLDEVETVAVSLTESLPNHPLPWKVLGIVFNQTGKVAQSLAAMQKSIQLAPQDAEAHNNLGIALKHLGRLDEAKASYTRAIALKPEYAEPHNNLGNIFKSLGKLDEAEASYTQAIEFKPDFIEAYFNLGIAHKDLGKFKDARLRFTQAIELKPDYAEAHSNLGITFKELSSLEQAESHLLKAIALEPRFAEAHYNLGNTRKELGKLREAEVSYRQAIMLKPDYAESHCSLGITLQELASFDEAHESFTQAISLKPDFTEAHYNLGMLFFMRREYKSAAEQFELSDTDESKLYAIQCSFHQDEKSIFYENFDLLVNQGHMNAVLGSLGFRSESKYGIKRRNSFCNDPLKHVVQINLKKLYDFEKIFIETAKDVLKNNSVSYKAQGHLTNGVQTAGNIFTQGKVPETEIKSIILTEIEKYRIQFQESEEGLIKNWPAAYEIKGWLVSMQSGGKLAPHMHDSGWITGSIYINVPPKTKADAGNLALCLSGQEDVVGVDDSRQHIIDVTTGDLCLFPSSLHHYTIPFEEKEDRIVLAFDVIPKTRPYL